MYINTTNQMGIKSGNEIIAMYIIWFLNECQLLDSSSFE
jgi:hypothetical protein